MAEPTYSKAALEAARRDTAWRSESDLHYNAVALDAFAARARAEERERVEQIAQYAEHLLDDLQMTRQTRVPSTIWERKLRDALQEWRALPAPTPEREG